MSQNNRPRDVRPPTAQVWLPSALIRAVTYVASMMLGAAPVFVRFCDVLSARQRVAVRVAPWAVAAMTTFTMIPGAEAAEVTWSGGDMTWTQPDATNWGGSTYVSGDDVVFTPTGAGTVTISGTVNPGNFSIIRNSTGTTTYTLTGGTLSASGTTFQVGPTATVTSNQAANVTAGMSGLTNFVYNNSLGTFRVGKSDGDGSFSTNQLTLAANNSITAASIRIADVGLATSSTGSNGTLRLGAVNVIRADDVNVGYSGRSNSTLNFANAASSATFRGTDGSSAVALWRVGLVNNNNTQTWTDTVDFSNGTIDALVTELTIGSAEIGSTNRKGANVSTFSMGDGTMTVAALTIGRIASTTGSVQDTLRADGTFTLNNAAGVLNAGTINLATNTLSATGGTRIVNGTFNLTSGTLKATTIQKGVQTGTATATAAFNWTDGTIQNIDGTNLLISSVPITLAAGTHIFNATGSNTITVADNSPIGGGGHPLTKTGTGRLVLNAANDYTGATTISAGILEANGSLASGSAVTVNGGTLQGSGSIGGSVTINGGGTLAAGNSIESLATGALSLAANATFAYELDKDAPSWEAGDLTAVTGSLTLDSGNGSLLTLTELGTSGTWDDGEKLTLVSYTEAWNGGLFTYDSNVLADDSTFTFDGVLWRLNYNDTVAGSNYIGDLTGASFVTMSVVVVPEPSTLALLGIGTLGLLHGLRRRRSCSSPAGKISGVEGSRTASATM